MNKDFHKPITKWRPVTVGATRRTDCLLKTHLSSENGTYSALEVIHIMPLLYFYSSRAKRRGVYEISVRRSIYWGPTDRPLKALIGENFKWPYLRKGLFDPLHVWFYGGVFGVGGSNGAISGFAKSKMAARKIQMAISPRRIIRFTPCLVLG